MQQILNIFKKEFKLYFVSPIAYIVISIFLIVAGWFFFSTFFLYNEANLRNFFTLLPIIFSFIIPAVTMRLFSEEINLGTYETLITMPLTFRDIILGKFLASIAFIGALLVPTLAYPITVSFLGQLDWGPVWGGYFGAILLAAAFSAIGLFASSLTKNQIVAFIIGTSICFVLYLFDKMLFLFPSFMVGVLEYLGADYHFYNISKGIIDSRDIIYFLSVSFIGLYCSHIVMKEE